MLRSLLACSLAALTATALAAEGFNSARCAKVFEPVAAGLDTSRVTLTSARAANTEPGVCTDIKLVGWEVAVAEPAAKFENVSTSTLLPGHVVNGASLTLNKGDKGLLLRPLLVNGEKVTFTGMIFTVGPAKPGPVKVPSLPPLPAKVGQPPAKTSDAAARERLAAAAAGFAPALQ